MSNSYHLKTLAVFGVKGHLEGFLDFTFQARFRIDIKYISHTLNGAWSSLHFASRPSDGRARDGHSARCACELSWGGPPEICFLGICDVALERIDPFDREHIIHWSFPNREMECLFNGLRRPRRCGQAELQQHQRQLNQARSNASWHVNENRR